MGDALADWLALREPFDAAARSKTLTRTLCGKLAGSRPLRIVDLGSGTGSNIRYLSRELPQPQEWLALDRDGDLLTHVPRGVKTKCVELGALDPEVFDRRDLVTASALLDLVSETWMMRLAERCRAAGAAVLFALSYDGRSTCAPLDPDDEVVRYLFNEHQRHGDKGFGVAAGPDAVDRAARAFGRTGYVVLRERSDWLLPPDSGGLQRMLIDGWARAAREIAPERAPAIGRWLERRLEHVAAGRSTITVGHQDLAGWLA